MSKANTGESPAQLEEIFRKVEPYITYLDVESLEAKQKDIGSKLDRLESENARLQAEVAKLMEKNKLRTEHLDHKETVLEIIETKYRELRERMDAMEGKPPSQWTTEDDKRL